MGSAVVIGLISGVLVYFAVLFIERTLKVDDPVGAISVHGVCGAWGTLAVGLFGERAIDILYWDAETAIADGLFFGGGFAQIGVQLLGVAAVLLFGLGSALAVFKVIDHTIGLRVSTEEEFSGLDLGEHGTEAYSQLTGSLHARHPNADGQAGVSLPTAPPQEAPQRVAAGRAGKIGRAHV